VEAGNMRNNAFTVSRTFHAEPCDPSTNDSCAFAKPFSDGNDTAAWLAWARVFRYLSGRLFRLSASSRRRQDTTARPERSRLSHRPGPGVLGRSYGCVWRVPLTAGRIRGQDRALIDSEMDLFRRSVPDDVSRIFNQAETRTWS
jgi:hypothetical protein